MHFVITLVPLRFLGAIAEAINSFGNIRVEARPSVAPSEYDIHAFTADPVVGEEAERVAKTLIITLMVREENARKEMGKTSMAARY